MLQGGIVGWANKGPEYVEWMVDYDAGFLGEAQGVAAEGVVLESTLTVRWDLVVTVMTFNIFSTSCLALPSSAFVDELRIRHRNRGLVWDGEHPHLASDYSSEIDCVELL